MTFFLTVCACSISYDLNNSVCLHFSFIIKEKKKAETGREGGCLSVGC